MKQIRKIRQKLKQTFKSQTNRGIERIFRKIGNFCHFHASFSLLYYKSLSDSSECKKKCQINYFFFYNSITCRALGNKLLCQTIGVQLDLLVSFVIQISFLTNSCFLLLLGGFFVSLQIHVGTLILISTLFLVPLNFSFLFTINVSLNV